MSFRNSYDDAGGKYLSEGWHEVRIREYRLFAANSGTEGIEFLVENDKGQTGKRTLWISAKAEGILVGFCKHCGLSREDMLKFDWDPVNMQEDATAIGEWAVGRPLRILVEREPGAKYADVTRSDYSQNPIPELRPQGLADVPPDYVPSGGGDIPF